MRHVPHHCTHSLEGAPCAPLGHVHDLPGRCEVARAHLRGGGPERQVQHPSNARMLTVYVDLLIRLQRGLGCYWGCCSRRSFGPRRRRRWRGHRLRAWCWRRQRLPVELLRRDGLREIYSGMLWFGGSCTHNMGPLRYPQLLRRISLKCRGPLDGSRIAERDRGTCTARLAIMRKF